MQWLSRGKFDRLPRTTVGFTTSAFDGYGLRRRSSLRPAPQASDPLLVHRLACLLCASFRPRLATRPLRFTITSRPSRCEEDLHLQAIEHARHTNKTAQPKPRRPFENQFFCALSASVANLYAAVESASCPSNCAKISRSVRINSSLDTWLFLNCNRNLNV